METIGQLSKFIAPKRIRTKYQKMVASFNSIHEITQLNNDWIKTTVPVSQAEQLLSVEIHEFHYENSGLTLYRTLDYYSVRSDWDVMSQCESVSCGPKRGATTSEVLFPLSPYIIKYLYDLGHDIELCCSKMCNWCCLHWSWIVRISIRII
jgi:hypothetical protein